MKLSTGTLALVALAATATLASAAEECMPQRPSRAAAWQEILIREGYLQSDGTPARVMRPLPRPFEDDHMQPPAPVIVAPAPPLPLPPPPEPEECQACGRG